MAPHSSPTAAPETALPSRIYGLDILRASAIILVLITHSQAILEPWAPWLRHFTVCGVMGVELFFVLSGFLIGQILLRMFSMTRPPSWGEIRYFWMRRWFRTLPNYFLILALILALNSALGLHRPDWRYFFFLQNFASVHPPAFGEAWSLAVEEWFYLTSPLFFLLAARIFPSVSPKNRTLGVILAVIALGLALRVTRALGAPVEWDAGIRKIVIFRPDAIMFGVLWAWVKTWRPAFMIRHAGFLAATGLTLVGGCTTYFIYMFAGAHLESSFFAQTVFFSLTSLALSLLLPFFDTIPHPDTLRARLVTHVSRTSYSIYLLHFSIILVLFQHYLLPPSLPIALYIFALYWGICLSVPSLLYATYERPVMNLRGWFTPPPKEPRCKNFEGKPVPNPNNP